MAKYFVEHVSNGNLQKDAITEHPTSNAAIVEYHNRLRTLWNSQDVVTAKVVILDDQLNTFGKYAEFVDHTPTPEPETSTTPTS